jgi:cytoskeleton protein RodZ
MPEIGATLREARMRARIDVSEIEAQTKIRAKYLRALENEEWDLLPGPTFVKSFLRTYADALGLDGKALVDEYKLGFEYAGEGERAELVQQPAASGTRQRSKVGQRGRARGGGAPRSRGAPGGSRGARPSRGYVAAVSAVAVVIVLLLIGLLSGGGGGSGGGSSNAGAPSGKASRGVSSGGTAAGRRHTGVVARAMLASLKLEPSAEVYVCLIGDGERKRIPGVILKPGLPEPVYHARRFELTLGNNAVTLIVNEKPVTVPASSAAIGYAITRTGMRELTPAEEPTCK